MNASAAGSVILTDIEDGQLWASVIAHKYVPALRPLMVDEVLPVGVQL